jgi:NADH:ubiquinone oxidoreductase subunit F (NADH-binding)/NADH:ubiquinone oxidoreductase subunit E
MSGGRSRVLDVERRYGRRGAELIERLRVAAADGGGLRPARLAEIAGGLGLPRAHVLGVASYYEDLASPEAAAEVRACAGTACFARTGGAHIARLREAAAGAGLSVREVRCLGLCYAAPSALVGEAACAGEGLQDQVAGRAPRQAPEIPFAAAVDEPIVLAGLAGGGPGAWEAWPRALAAGAERVLDEVARSGLSGRGGAAFPVARKWRAVREAGDAPRHVVANGDEGDPGSFADRLLMERDPHRVLEGLAIAGLACGASRGVAYVRSEYPAARDALREAAAEARAAGHLGRDVHGSGLDFEVEVAVGAGSYVAGEETALISSLEGARGGAQVRPPYPAQDGLGGRPTAVNNVETLCAVPWIVARGGDALARRGTPGSRGTKLVSLNERFARPGVYEIELGTPLARVVHDLGGGLREGARLRSLQVGGPLGGFLSPADLDAPLSYEGMRERGIALGHGGLVAIDERRTGAELHEHLWGFAAEESCGNCAPCRVGSRRGLELARRMAAGRDDGRAPAELTGLIGVMETASLCGFGRGLAPVVRSLRRVYGDELGAPSRGPGPATRP